MRVLLVVGSAPCLFDDVQTALELYPTAELMLINGACTAYINAEHVLAGHTNKAALFAKARREKFPTAPPWRLHANWTYPGQKETQPDVTDWHGPEMSTGATSAGKAARIGLALGYDRVILCGCPLDFGGGYFAAEAKVPHDCVRVGTPKDMNSQTMRRYREKLALLATREPFKSKVFSMSGYSRSVLGAPE